MVFLCTGTAGISGSGYSTNSIINTTNQPTGKTSRHNLTSGRNKPVSLCYAKETYVKLLSRAFTDIVSPAGQLTFSTMQYSGNISANTTSPSTLPIYCSAEYPSTMIASAFLVRGKNIPMSEFLNCVISNQKKFVFPSWNENACKIGLCSTSAPNEAFSLLGIYNR